ncbi:hypothetical protein [Pseudochryseolinea flava]|uniref:Uncharacterized protein n=1 Tax=Pseudochryseolinea flava TaxID=2059302 RepID=A0A364Y4M4_9BACT|nr:hypothetical protein [Pseudochryseolinea flava]RAW00755.1 hypothetical protein DQQ10_14345 [Pseudochryseolinea flava]
MAQQEFKTKWASELPPWGAFDDYVILESSITHDKFITRPEEFNFMMDNLFAKWQEKKIEYIQVLKDWNECLGAWSVEASLTVIEDLPNFIDTIKLIDGVDNGEAYGILENRDLKRLMEFLIHHQDERISIREE